MKLQTRIGLTVLSVILGTLAIWGIGSIIYNHSNWTYTGKAVFNTVDEYTQFKLAVGQMEPNQIEKLQVLSSEPPIVAFFTVDAPAHTDFPYGNQDKYTDWIEACVAPFFFFGLGIAFLNMFAIWRIQDYG